ncbi:MAG: hypothetical protein HZB39_06645 [Planctomycetes bacterium]|nr:hypothetical protein [Planctomycetota bacterium]
MVRRPRGTRAATLVAWVFLVVVVFACGGPPRPVDELEVAAAEGGFVAPFAKPTTIVADELVIEMTANFYDELATPAGINGSQRVARPDGGSEYVFRNATPGGHLTFLLRQTEIVVLRSARIVVFGGRHALTFDLAATGRVSIVDPGGRRDGSRYRVSGGNAALEP